MTAPAVSPSILGERLLPWLSAPLATLDQARHSRRLGHAWLLSGAPGIGKINLALVFAARVLGNASAAPPPLTQAEALEAYRLRHEPADHHPDLHWVFPDEDKRSISIDQIRAMTRELSLKGHSGAAKLVVIEPADAMTIAAANALLKTLEEPTPDTYLLLVSHQPGRLPATIRSRCQRLNVAPPDAAALAAWRGAAAGGSAAAFQGPRALEETAEDTIKEINMINANIESVSTGRLDPQTLADRWLKCDLDSLLGALAGCLQAAIRAEFAAQASKPVTDRPIHILHNAPAGARLRLLFDQLRGAETLRDRIGRGTNAELALKVLLSGFKPA